jgi:N-acetylglucosamine-6-sulfatase
VLSNVTKRYRCQLASLVGVDRSFEEVVTALRDNHALRNTAIFFTSDNGFFFGEHRIVKGKGLVYEPALRVPFAISVPRAFRSGPIKTRSHAVVANQDVAPTILRYVNRYGGSATACNPPGDCRQLDGRSLVPLLGRGRHAGWRDRGVLAEIDSRRSLAGSGRSALRRRTEPECNCAYEAIRTRSYLYSKLSTGERELYDLARDPDELRNRARSPRYATTRRKLAARLRSLERCSGRRASPGAAPPCE